MRIIIEFDNQGKQQDIQVHGNNDTTAITAIEGKATDAGPAAYLSGENTFADTTPEALADVIPDHIKAGATSAGAAPSGSDISGS
jgi:hypothetical protein